MPKRRSRKTLPTFTSESDERRFWETHDTSSFVDWSQARVAVFPNLKPSTETISLRLPAALLAELKALAREAAAGALADKAAQRTGRSRRSRAGR
jgi:hypothetical protein